MKPEEISVVILAAGHGTRMRPLTDNTPKPLLKVRGLSLIEHHLKNLTNEGFREVVINIAYLGDKIVQQLGDGGQFNLNIRYSDESQTGALETAGGLRQALPLIASDPFLVVNADIFTDFSFASALAPLAHNGRLIVVENPPQNPDGDFSILDSDQTKTFSGIALYNKSIFRNLPDQNKARL